MAGLSSLQRWERLLHFPKLAAFIIGMSVALPDSLRVGNFGSGVHVRCSDLSWNTGQFNNGIVVNLFQMHPILERLRNTKSYAAQTLTVWYGSGF